MFAYGETVTRKRAGVSTDPYSTETVADWSLDTIDIAFTGCAVWQEQSTEPVAVRRDEVITWTWVAFQPGADVTATDRLLIRGELYDIFGDPFDWRSPLTGWNPGKVAKCRKVDG